MTLDLIQLSKIHSEIPDFSATAVKLGAAEALDPANAAGSEMILLVKALVKGGIIKFIVDLDGMTSIDSRGIGVLINAAKLIREKRGDLVLIRVPDHIDRIFQPVSLQRFIKIFPAEQEAVNYLKYLQ